MRETLSEAEFLIYRVELKLHILISFLSCRTLFLIYRVELKHELPFDRSLREPRFLIYRVELKLCQPRP